MKRRDLITLLGGATAAWPLMARAQQTAVPVIGLLHNAAREAPSDFLSAFQKGLMETGFVEGRNVAIEYRFAGNRNERLPGLAAELVRHQVAVIAAPGSPLAALAAKAATTTIPIVFSGTNPVQLGLVASLNHPGGNVTGISAMSGELAGKQFGLLQELAPGATRFAMLLNPDNPSTASQMIDVRDAASTLGRTIEFVSASSAQEIVASFADLTQKRIDALLVQAEPLFAARRTQLVLLAAHAGMPAIYGERRYAEAGGLMSYGPSLAEQFRQVGIYTGRILKGEKPSDLPVQQPTKFELIVNLQAAMALGLTVPASLLAIADEVIE
jgi:putative tryptophan/tyrosine transport system substrate-binding protein